MEELNVSTVVFTLLFGSGLCFLLVRFIKEGFFINLLWVGGVLFWAWSNAAENKQFLLVLLLIGLPLLFINILCYVFFPKESESNYLEGSENRKALALAILMAI